MSAIIKAENLGKKYIIRHEHPERYVALRDVLTQKAKKLFSFPSRLRPKAPAADYEEFWALKDLNFEIQQGDRVGIIGRNGAGKSTLLKILSRITEPSTGRITLKGRVASLLEVGTGFHPELTGRENIYLNGAILGMSRAEIKHKFDEIVDFSSVEKFLDTPVKRYSSGMYVRLAFSVAAHLEPEILVVDEVLAVGDAEFQKKCLGKMEDVSKKDGRTVLFVSHNIGMVVNLCNVGIMLEKGELSEQGSISSVITKYTNKDLGNRVLFKKHIKFVSINQIEDNIQIEVEYETDSIIDIPHFGFVIKNNLGFPIFGSNPTIELIENRNKKINTKSGNIKIKIIYPKLINGDYNASIWFGDSKHNLLESIDCLTFNVTNMSKQRQLNPTIVGHVLPVCQWNFE